MSFAYHTNNPQRNKSIVLSVNNSAAAPEDQSAAVIRARYLQITQIATRQRHNGVRAADSTAQSSSRDRRCPARRDYTRFTMAEVAEVRRARAVGGSKLREEACVNDFGRFVHTGDVQCKGRVHKGTLNSPATMTSLPVIVDNDRFSSHAPFAFLPPFLLLLQQLAL